MKRMQILVQPTLKYYEGGGVLLKLGENGYFPSLVAKLGKNENSGYEKDGGFGLEWRNELPSMIRCGDEGPLDFCDAVFMEVTDLGGGNLPQIMDELLAAIETERVFQIGKGSPRRLVKSGNELDPLLFLDK